MSRVRFSKSRLSSSEGLYTGALLHIGPGAAECHFEIALQSCLCVNLPMSKHDEGARLESPASRLGSLLASGPKSNLLPVVLHPLPLSAVSFPENSLIPRPPPLALTFAFVCVFAFWFCSPKLSACDAKGTLLWLYFFGFDFPLGRWAAEHNRLGHFSSRSSRLAGVRVERRREVTGRPALLLLPVCIIARCLSVCLEYLASRNPLHADRSRHTPSEGHHLLLLLLQSFGFRSRCSKRGT